jgi:hypothetical protein
MELSWQLGVGGGKGIRFRSPSSLRPYWMAFLSILQDYSPVVPHVRTVEAFGQIVRQRRQTFDVIDMQVTQEDNPNASLLG